MAPSGKNVQFLGIRFALESFRNNPLQKFMICDGSGRAVEPKKAAFEHTVVCCSVLILLIDL